MHLKIRTKVLIGILFLFIEFLAIGIMSIYYFSSIKNSTELMIKNNYHSVQYAENMIQAIDDTQTNVATLFLNKWDHFDENTLNGSLNKFEENLAKEEKNITEFGEKELSQSIHQLFFKLRDEFGQTFVIVTHNETFANMADRKLVMKDGLIV